MSNSGMCQVMVQFNPSIVQHVQKSARTYIFQLDHSVLGSKVRFPPVENEGRKASNIPWILGLICINIKAIVHTGAVPIID